MIADIDALQKLVDSNPQEGELITGDQSRWLDQALYWDEVEGEFGLEEGTLESIYNRVEPMTLDVLEILWDLNGGGPVTETEEPDLWL